MSDELKALRRIEALMQTLVKISLAEPMSRLLTDDTLRGLYEKTGKLKREQLEKQTGFSAGKISGLWSQWEQAGLLVKEGKTYRKPFESSADED